MHDAAARARWLAGAALTIAALSACAANVDGHGEQAGPTAFPPSSAAPAAAAKPTSAPQAGSPALSARDHARLQATLVRAADLPGWKGSPDTDTQDDGEDEMAALVACVGTGHDTRLDVLGEIESLDFTKGNVEISSDATLYKSTSDVASDKALILNPKTAACEKSQARKEFAQDLPVNATVSHFDVTITPRAAGDPYSVVARIHSTFGAISDGQHLDFEIVSTVLARGRIEAEVDDFATNATVDVALDRKLVRTVADRVAQA